METQRTTLRRPQLSDFNNLRLLESDPDIMKFSPSRIPQTEEQTQERLLAQIERNKNEEPFGIWLAEEKVSDKFIGWFKLTPMDGNMVEIGYMIVQTIWGQGYTTEICQTLIDFAKENNISTVVATTNLDNLASIRVLEKLGFYFAKNLIVPEKVFGGEIEVKLFELQLNQKSI